MCALGFTSDRTGVAFSLSYAPRLPLSQSKEGQVRLYLCFGSSCLAGKEGCFACDSSSGRILPVITSAGSSLISSFLAVSCFIGEGLKGSKERIVHAQINIAHGTRYKSSPG